MIGNWILESCSTVGSGDLILTGAPSEYTSFSQWFKNGDLLYYTVQEGENSESGQGQYTAGRIVRTPKSTLVNGVVNKDSPLPITLSGDAIVACIMSAEAYNGLLSSPALDNHILDKNNPHDVTKSQVGLTNVPNLDTTDAVNHTSRTDNPHDMQAEQVDYDNADSSLGATDVYGALDALETKVDNSSAYSGEIHTSSVISFTGMVPDAVTPATKISIPNGTGIFVINGVTTQAGWKAGKANAETVDLLPYMAATGPGVLVIVIETDNEPYVYDSVGRLNNTEEITLGQIFYSNQVITGISNTPVWMDSTSDTAFNILNFLKNDVKQRGLRVRETITGMTLYRGGGSILVPGGVSHANIRQFPAAGNETVPVGFTPIYIDDSGDNISEVDTSIVPKFYINSGIKTALAGSESTIHYLFMDAMGQLYLFYGNNMYSTKDAAIGSMEVDIRTTDFMAELDEYFLLSQIMINNSSTDFGDGDSYIFVRYGL